MGIIYEKIIIVETACVEIKNAFQQCYEIMLDKNLLENLWNNEPIPEKANDIVRDFADKISNLISDDFAETEVINEIRLNLAGIESEPQLKRYLDFIYQRLVTAQDLIREEVGYHELSSAEILLQEIESGRHLIGNKIKLSNSLLQLKLSGLAVIEQLQEVLDYINQLLYPDQNLDYSENQHDITANSHRLLLLHKLGYFEPLFNAHYNVLGAVKFSRLIATLLGIPKDNHEGFRPSVTNLISTIGNKMPANRIKNRAAENKVNAYLTELGLLKKQ